MINLAGVPGFEPGMPESESGALPLGDTPIELLMVATTGFEPVTPAL
ncbi:conserved hypothetical protein [Xenorhabdus bovienii str. Intermedium]|uniref:Uncharacterized protein n=1 Tax=Xenorhabdus bovienii str. Intermedium TaxID=1379677 RepID=A0A077QBU6_XENBV|nr:conserved hypothetical protein [Xenorhabdus bovienii str. Intermedium]